MQCLIIDNYDSFTWNLADYVTQVFQTPPVVIKNDFATWQYVLEHFGPFEAIIISPGPGTVTCPADFGISEAALRQDDIPVLGVCLGFQGLVQEYGGCIKRANTPYHGRSTEIRHTDGQRLFHNIPPRFSIVRYHSLIADPQHIPDCLAVLAQSDCGIPMAVGHQHLPKWGVQFHPESILSEYGMQLIENFKQLVMDYHRSPEVSTANRALRQHDHPLAQSTARTHAGAPAHDTPQSLTGYSAHQMTADHTDKVAYARQLPLTLDDFTLFQTLFAQHPHCFWLDSQTARNNPAADTADNQTARFSIMGCGDPSQTMIYQLQQYDADFSQGKQFLQQLDDALQQYQVTDHQPLPFEFRGGYIGYFSYEMKRLWGGQTRHRNEIPDALWIKAEQFAVIDQKRQTIWLVAIETADQQGQLAAENWFDLQVSLLRHPQPDLKQSPHSQSEPAFAYHAAMDKQAYLDAIAQCQQQIVYGNSYEVCLTNQFFAHTDIDPLALYNSMRRHNPAPFGGFIRADDTHILSTSPEQFIKVDRSGTVTAKPMKGTAPRHADPQQDAMLAQQLATSEKDRAENLMIVDLMRNDLAQVSHAGSVSVPALMQVEHYQTLHQMISVVQAKLLPETSLINLLAAVYPGGSISGAPKLRTLQIIDQLELQPRGIYCGSMGFLGYNRITELNIAIRTFSYDGTTLRFGAGGAVTYLSTAEQEYQEMILKRDAILTPLLHYLQPPT